MRAAFLAPVVIAMLAGPALAAPRCMVRATKPTGAMQDPSSVMEAGERFGPITQVRIAKSNGAVSYCAHGSYCYPSTNLEFVSPCKVESFANYQDDDERIYSPR